MDRAPQPEFHRLAGAGSIVLLAVLLALSAAAIQLLAQQQPMARDLRLIAAALSITTDLERIADLATNIAAEVVYLVEGRTIKHHAEERRAAG